MTTYNSYEEAKIANPEQDIYQSGNDFIAMDTNGLWMPCEPKDHCMTVEKFLADGHKFVDGDLIIERDCVSIKRIEPIDLPNFNIECRGDENRYTLRSEALNKPKRTKVEYVKFEFVSDKEKAEAFIEGGLRYFTHGEVRGDLEHDTIPVTRLDELLCGNAIYRRIETEIDERQEFIDFVESKCSEINADCEWSFACIAAELFDSGRVKLND